MQFHFAVMCFIHIYSKRKVRKHSKKMLVLSVILNIWGKKPKKNRCVFWLQVQTVVKKVSVPVSNQSEPVTVNRKKLEFKWGMNVLGKKRPSCVNIVLHAHSDYCLWFHHAAAAQLFTLMNGPVWLWFPDIFQRIFVYFWSCPETKTYRSCPELKLGTRRKSPEWSRVIFYPARASRSGWY